MRRVLVSARGRDNEFTLPVAIHTVPSRMDRQRPVEERVHSRSSTDVARPIVTGVALTAARLDLLAQLPSSARCLRTRS